MTSQDRVRSNVRRLDCGDIVLGVGIDEYTLLEGLELIQAIAEVLRQVEVERGQNE